MKIVFVTVLFLVTFYFIFIKSDVIRAKKIIFGPFLMFFEGL